MSNYDPQTGIHFGVISPNSISSETLDDLCFGANSTDPHYEDGKNEIEDIIDRLQDYVSDTTISEIKNIALDDWSDHYENSDGQHDYEDTEYKLHISGDNFGIFVIKSPYYTYCRLCSPCAPNAGDLNNPIKADHRLKDISQTGAKTYCLDKEFFDPEYAKIPYRYYRVSDDKEVLEDIIEVY